MKRRRFLLGTALAAVSTAGCTGEEMNPETTKTTSTRESAATNQATSATDTSTTESTTQPTADDATTATSASSRSIEVKVIYDGSWQGAVGTAEGTRSVDGTGTSTFAVDESANVVSANAQKQDDSNQRLTIQIIVDEVVIAERSTTSEYGVAQVSQVVPANPTTNTRATTDSTNSEGGTGSSTSISVKISYDGEWQGTVGTSEGTRTVQGSGTETFSIDSSASIVSANAQKMDDEGGELTVQIVVDGDVVAEQSTTAEYGVAQVSETV